MKIKKNVLLFLASLCILAGICVVNVHRVYAKSQSNDILNDKLYNIPYANLDFFQIKGIGDVERNYSSQGRIYFNTAYLQSFNSETPIYNVNTKEVGIKIGIYQDSASVVTQVAVDGSNKGDLFESSNQDIKCIYGSTELIGSYKNETYAIKYMSPGIHTIEIAAYHMVKKDLYDKRVIITFRVYVPAVTNDNIKKSIDNITKGSATAYDYEVVGVKLQGLSIEDANSAAKGLSLDPGNVQDKLNEVIKQKVEENEKKKSLARINAGNGWLSDYKLFSITGVNNDNISFINKLITLRRSKSGQDLAVNEIQTAVNDLNSSKNRIDSGKGSLEDYEVLGITTVDSSTLEDVNWYTGQNGDNTISKIKSNVNSMLAALQAINKGTAFYYHYNRIGINTVTSETASKVNTAVIEAAKTKGSNLTRAEIEKVTSNIVTPLNNAIFEIAAGKGTINDYQTLGIITVTSSTLQDVNWYVGSRDSNMISKIKANVSTILLALKSINTGTICTSYYNTLGITAVTSDNANQVKTAVLTAARAKGSNLTKSEIEKVVSDTVTPLNNAVAEISSEKGTIEDYKSLGIITVTEANLKDVNWYISGKDLKTINGIKTNVSTILTALKSINTGTTATGYYNTLGITTVTQDNAGYVKIAILDAVKAKGSNLDRDEIKKIVSDKVTSLNNIIVEIEDGKGTVSDYQDLGITMVTSSVLKDVNWYVSSKNSSTISKIKTNVSTIISVLKSINNGTVIINYYNTLGITMVTTDNAEKVKASILAAVKTKGSNLTKTEIEKTVSDEVTLLNSSISHIAVGNGTLNDYQVIGISTVDSPTLSDVNWYVNSKNSTTIYNIKNNVSQILTALKCINIGTTSTDYYSTLGISGVTVDNANQIKTAILSAVKAKGSNLTKSEIEKVVSDTVTPLNNAIAKISDGKGTVNDYQTLGITTVTDSTLEDVNWYVTSKYSSTISSIKSNVSTLLKALNVVNRGTTGVNYYNTLGMTTVTSKNVSQVKTAILAAVKAKGSNLTRAEIEKAIQGA